MPRAQIASRSWTSGRLVLGADLDVVAVRSS